MGQTDWGNLVLAASALLGVVGLLATFGFSLTHDKPFRRRRR